MTTLADLDDTQRSISFAMTEAEAFEIGASLGALELLARRIPIPGDSPERTARRSRLVARLMLAYGDAPRVPR